jgi:protocatechuate 3,4-dioxygenase alpha subunit
MTMPVAAGPPTPSQTVGPYLHIGLAPRYATDIAFDGSTAQPNRIVIEGRAVDGAGAPAIDGMIEIWQADAAGRYAHADDATSGHDESMRSASGFGRIPVADDGSFAFSTVKPGRVRAPDGTLQAPHLVVAFFSRGLLKHLSTRIYFGDEASANAEDLVLHAVPAPRRATLVARPTGPGRYAWSLTTQGAPSEETVFFDF